jgi:hypothetical protein
VTAPDIQLYNILKDKKETTNLAANEPKKVDELKAKLMAWWQTIPHLK